MKQRGGGGGVAEWIEFQLCVPFLSCKVFRYTPVKVGTDLTHIKPRVRVRVSILDMVHIS